MDPLGLDMCDNDECLIGFDGGGGYAPPPLPPLDNPGYCGPWNASCGPGGGTYGSSPDWVFSGHWSAAAWAVLLGQPLSPDPDPEHTDIKPWELRGSAVAVLRATNPCSSWFNQGTGSAGDIMSHVEITLFNPPAGPLPYADAQTTNDPRSPIEVNSRGRFYASSDNQLPLVGYDPGSYGARMDILFHELAHKVQPPSIVDDKFSTAESDKNAKTVADHCSSSW